jgi:hypothetical protein
MSAPSHIIEVLNPGGSSEWFCGWDTHGSPELSFDRDDASKYDLMFHRDECMDDYERLCNLGFDASIETNGFVRRDYSEVARLESWASQIAVGANLLAAE